VDSVASRLRKRVKTEEKEETLPENAVENVIKVKATIKTLKARDIHTLFPVQFNSYASLLEGKDMIAKDRTGSGKTLGFLLPTLDKLRISQQLDDKRRGRYPKVLVLLPTRELCIQVFNEFEKMKNHLGEYEAVAVYGGTEIYDQKEKLRKGCDIIIGTPGRVIDLINRHNLILNDIGTFILDEADRMLDMGFSDDIEKVIEECYTQQDTHSVKEKKFQTVLFSATIPRWVHDIARKYLDEKRLFIDMVKLNGN
jgi:ATP-dependent RNA helicase DDX21